MAEYKTTIALEIGAQSVVMAVFTPVGRRFSLSRYIRKDILLDPVEEGMRIDYVSHALAEMVKKLKVRGKDVRNVVSGQKVFMRFVKLPALDTVDDLQEQVGYEVRQHIPFPLEDIIYAYQKLGDAVDGEQEVLLVAIKKDELDELNSQVEANSLHTKSVDCSTTSLYNAFCASYPDEKEPVMLLDIGAKTTDILFIEEGRLFTRSVTAAGAFVTNSIAREFNLSFREAEQMKIDRGLISLGNGHTDSMDETTANLATVIRNAVNRLSSEVQRTINHYRANYKGSSPAKAYICGGGARLPFMAEFLQSVLDIPVEFLDPLKSMTVSSKVNSETLQMDALCLGPVVGAAVTGAKVGVFNIDLVPTSVGKDRAEKRLIPIALASGVAALLGAGYFYHVCDARAKAAQELLVRTEPAVQKLDRLDRRISESQSKLNSEKKALERRAELYNARYAYADILTQIAERTAHTAFWLSDFEPLINYDGRVVHDAQSNERDTTVLINRNKPIGSSAINTPPEVTDARDKKVPMVNAIRLVGYTFKSEIGRDGTAKMIADLLDANFSENAQNSLFSIPKNLGEDKNRYILVQDTTHSKGSIQIPDYVDKVTIIMPLAKPLPIPELQPEKK